MFSGSNNPDATRASSRCGIALEQATFFVDLCAAGFEDFASSWMALIVADEAMVDACEMSVTRFWRFGSGVGENFVDRSRDRFSFVFGEDGDSIGERGWVCDKRAAADDIETVADDIGKDADFDMGACEHGSAAAFEEAAVFANRVEFGDVGARCAKVGEECIHFVKLNAGRQSAEVSGSSTGKPDNETIIRGERFDRGFDGN